MALLQFDGVLDADELNAVAAGTKVAANAKAKAAVEKWLAIGLHCEAMETEQRRLHEYTRWQKLWLHPYLCRRRIHSTVWVSKTKLSRNSVSHNTNFVIFAVSQHIYCTYKTAGRF